ncbi:MAG TPA: asparagine--tRNA ligase [Candidatus Acidoferrum sp.]|nr:asparagine--tRNA ligase [Candidatus Acidoferrum sp.]
MTDFVVVRKILTGSAGSARVKVRGWLHNRRSSGGVLFLIVRDGTGFLQCTAKKDQLGEKFSEIETVPLESTIEVEGEITRDPRAPRGYELRIADFKVLHRSHDDFPIAKKYHGPEFLLDNRHFWIRSKKMQTILRVRALVIEESRRWLKEHDYLEVQVPILVSAAVEGGSTLFEVKYFDEKAYLTQSWQLYAEAMIASLGKIYTLAPSFRAEKSRTRRHLTEYWHLELEEPWLDLEGLIKVEEGLLLHICHQVAAQASDELEELGREPSELASLKAPLPTITYDRAVELIRKSDSSFEWGTDLGYNQEKILTKEFTTPFFVTHYPKSVKAFYHMLDPKRPEVTLSVDLLAPEGYGEITGGGQRIHDYEQLMQRIDEEHLNPKDYSWYLDLRKYGTVPHSGFGMGIERTVAWVCKLRHIRDAAAFPRLMNRIRP